MYINALTHLGTDIHRLRGQRKVKAMTEAAIAKKRICLYYLFESQALRLGDSAECIWSRTASYTWKQSYERCHQYGRWFLEKGVKPGDLVGFYLMNSADFMLAWLGLWSIGAAPAMINYNLGGKALVHCLKISGAKILLVDDEPDLQARIAEVAPLLEKEYPMQLITLGAETKREIDAMSTQRPPDELREQVKADWPMCLFYTSGTTGMPKGCVFANWRGFERGTLRQAGFACTTPDDRWYDCMPLYHGTGGVTAVTQMMDGVTLLVGKKFSTSRFWDDIRDSRATWFVYVGETARYLLAAPPSPRDKDHHLRGMYGNGLRPDVWIRFRERFAVPEVFEFFNSTEGVFGLAVHARGDYLAQSVGHHGLLARWTMRHVVVPVKIDQETGDIARDPKTGFAIRESYEKGGEIIVAVNPDFDPFPGYYKNEDATAKKYLRDVFKRGDRWYRTGDALRRTGDGHWYFLDRLGDTFRWKGENVSTAEVSEVLGKFPGVVEANVYGVALPGHDGRAGCAAIYIKPEERQRLDYAGLLK
jgi:acyl-CoA synthetase (AMP-forming)/AMP-acid ligase II